jgi:hypothetical protein
MSVVTLWRICISRFARLVLSLLIAAPCYALDWGSPVLMSNTGITTCTYSVMARSTGQTVIAVGRQPGQGLVVSRSTDAGSTWSAPVLMAPLTTESTHLFAPSIATDNKGVWVAAWYEFGPGHPSRPPDYNCVRAARSGDDGLTWSPPVLLLQGGINDTVVLWRPVSIAGDGHGNWIVAWDNANLTDLSQGYALPYVRSSDGALTWSSTSFFDTAYTDCQPSVCAGRFKEFMLVWRAAPEYVYGPGGGHYSGPVYLRSALTSDGGATWTTATLQTGDVYCPKLVTDRRGAWLVTYDSGSYTTRTLSAVRSVDNGAAWNTPVVLTVGPVASFGHSMAADGFGNAIVAWRSSVPQDDPLIATSSDFGLSWSASTSVCPSLGQYVPETYDCEVDLANGPGGEWLALWASLPTAGTTLTYSAKAVFGSSLAARLWQLYGAD